MPQSQYPTINAGTDYTAGLIQAFSPFYAWKAADTSRTTNTLAADPDLTFSVAASATYGVEASFLYKGNTTGSGDFKFLFSVPAGSSLPGGFIGINNPLGVYILPETASTTLVSYTNGTANPLWCQVRATLFTSGTAGTFALTWAQNTSNATATTLMAGSRMQLTRMQ